VAIQNSLNLTDTGIIAHDGAGVFTGRTVTGTADEIVVSNGSGVSGNPTIGLSVPVKEIKGGTNQTAYTTGDILYASATDTISKLPIGTSSEVLTVTGGLPTWEPSSGGGSGLVYLATATASNSAFLSFDNTYITSAYDNYFIMFDNILTTAIAIPNWFVMRYSVNNGSTWMSTAFDYLSMTTDLNRLTSYAGFSDTTLIYDAGQTAGTTAGPISGHMNIIRPLSASIKTTSISHLQQKRYNSTQTGSHIGSMLAGANGVHNAIQFLFLSGTMSTGEIHLYGYSEA